MKSGCLFLQHHYNAFCDIVLTVLFKGEKMSFKGKVILALSALMFLSLSIFSIISYMDTKKNSVIQVEASLQMASRALTDYIDVWIAGKKSGVESAARYLTNVQSMNRDDVKVTQIAS